MVVTMAGIPGPKYCITVQEIHAVRILRATGTSVCNKNYRYFDHLWIAPSYNMPTLLAQYSTNTPLQFEWEGTSYVFIYDSRKRPLVRPKPKKEPAPANKRARFITW